MGKKPMPIGIDDQKEILVSIIKNHLPDCQIYLFGSRSRDEKTSGSDFDLALNIGKKIDTIKMTLIKNDIEESVIPVFVDLVDIHEISNDFLKTIKTEWIKWK